MRFELLYTPEADSQLSRLKAAKAKQLPAVQKALRLMASNLRHPSLQTHKYESMKGPDGRDVFESYADNHTPGAYRIFWIYGPSRRQITVVAVVPHP